MRIKIYTTDHPNEDEYTARVCVGEAQGATMTTHTNLGTAIFDDGTRIPIVNAVGNMTLNLDSVYFFAEHLHLLVWATVKFQVCIEVEPRDNAPMHPVEFNDCFVRSLEKMGPDNPRDPGAFYDRMELAVAYTVSVDGTQKKPMETDEVKAWLARWARR